MRIDTGIETPARARPRLRNMSRRVFNLFIRIPARATAPPQTNQVLMGFTLLHHVEDKLDQISFR
jgi:hypothetical protein